MIIGLTGRNGTGKTEVANYLKSKGFELISLSDILREEARKRNMDEKRYKIKELLDFAINKRNYLEKIDILEKLKLKAGDIIKAIREKYKAQDLKDYLQSEIDKLKEETEKLEEEKQELVKELFGISAEIKQIDKNVKAIDDFEKGGYATCPTCYQKVDPAILEEAKKSFIEKGDKLKNKQKGITQELNELKEAIEGKEKRIKALKEDLEDVTRAIDDVSDYQKQINELQEKLKKLPETESEEEYKQKLDEIGNEIRELEVRKRLNQQILADLTEVKTPSIEEIEFQEQFIKLLEKTIKEHKKEILDQKLTEVKQLIKNEWKELMKEEVWGVEFDKQFVPMLDYKGTQRSIKGLSGSEKIMLSIIVRAAFMHKIMSNKTLVLDDPTISLDDVHLESSAKFYKKLIEGRYLKQIILSSFNQRFKEFLQADQVIELA